MWEASPRTLRPESDPRLSPRNTASYDPFRQGSSSPRPGRMILCEYLGADLTFRLSAILDTMSILSTPMRRNLTSNIYLVGGLL